MPDSVLSLKSVTKIYTRSHLGRTFSHRGVEDLSLDIQAGEVFGLLGLNGSGKTTVFKLATGLLVPTSGEMTVFGLSPGRVSVHERLGFLPELPYFYPFMTPEETLRFYGRLSGLNDGQLSKRIDAVLDSVHLSNQRGRKIKEFSKGMTQRVGLAQAILHDPDLIILDEPASGLDPLAIKEMRDTLSALNARGKTLLISSHSISELEKLCGRVGILKEGRLEKIVSAAQWKDAPGGLESLFVEAVK